MGIDSTKNGNLFDGVVRKTTNLQPFFGPLRELLIAFAWGRRNVCSLYRYLDETEQPHRSRFNNFLNLTRWQPAVVLALKAQELLAALSPQPGETVELVLDDSKKRKRGKAGAYGRNLFRQGRQAKKTFAIQKEHGPVRYTGIDAGWMKVSSLGRLHVVFSRKQGEPKILGLVTDDPKLSARQIITAYDHRWQIEVFFKDGKQLLGLGHYQDLSSEAAVNHLHLVFLAYALLTHMAISDGRSAQGRQTHTRRRSTADLQNELRRLVWGDLTKHLRHFSSGTEVIKELQRLLVAA